MLNNLHKRLHGEEGFTLIELLVVILIIGILAAIAIPSFLNQKGKGEDTAAKASARSAQTAMETYYTDQNQYQCGTTEAQCDTALRTIEQTLPPNGTAGGQLNITSGSTPGSGLPGLNDYSVTVTSNPSLRTFTITKVNGSVTRSCSIPSYTAGSSNLGGCKNPNASGVGSW